MSISGMVCACVVAAWQQHGVHGGASMCALPECAHGPAPHAPHWRWYKTELAISAAHVTHEVRSLLGRVATADGNCAGQPGHSWQRSPLMRLTVPSGHSRQSGIAPIILKSWYPALQTAAKPARACSAGHQIVLLDDIGAVQ